jgi:hypothetical protein
MQLKRVIQAPKNTFSCDVARSPAKVSAPWALNASTPVAKPHI